LLAPQRTQRQSERSIGSPFSPGIGARGSSPYAAPRRKFLVLSLDSLQRNDVLRAEEVTSPPGRSLRSQADRRKNAPRRSRATRGQADGEAALRTSRSFEPV